MRRNWRAAVPGDRMSLPPVRSEDVEFNARCGTRSVEHRSPAIRSELSLDSARLISPIFYYFRFSNPNRGGRYHDDVRISREAGARPVLRETHGARRGHRGDVAGYRVACAGADSSRASAGRVVK